MIIHLGFIDQQKHWRKDSRQKYVHASELMRFYKVTTFILVVLIGGELTQGLSVYKMWNYFSPMIP